MTEYASFFTKVTDGQKPHPWQEALADDACCRDRTIRIPTGFGKTAGIVLAWLYHRVLRNDDAWPRRLVFCLPMRVLVEQTERAIETWLDRSGLNEEVRLHVLMGGVRADRWVLEVDRPSILVGTQDMLLSRALNRGYGSGRALWPMEHGLLHHDALWTLDEIQLMDVGLATSVQLAAFRESELAKKRGGWRPAHTWWMSATLQPRWLETVDRVEPSEPSLSIPAELRTGGLFDVRKTLVRATDVRDAKAIAECVRARHVAGKLTLVIVNRVATALDVYDALDDAFHEGKGKKRQRLAGMPDLELVHSRFRGVERVAWADRFLRKGAPIPDAGRIIVATQVVEAGVDISARTLVTELAPWASLVQRFGRAARYPAESADVVVAGAVPGDEKAAAPYSCRELAAADEGLSRLLAREGDASPRSLEAFEDELAKRDREMLARLYPYEPIHVLRRRDVEDLFDTSADSSGADLDVSRFIRSGEERDVSVFWRHIEGTPRALRLEDPPRREELCPVPLADIRKWEGKIYVLDYLEGTWTPRDRRRLASGMTVLLDAAEGGYTKERGWDVKAKSVEPVPLAIEAREPLTESALAEGAEDLSVASWKTIATHGREAAEEACSLCATLGLPEDLARVVVLAARWHDVGKAHEIFQGAIDERQRQGRPIGARRDLAKAPVEAWKRPPYAERPGFRHEFASTLALFELLRRANPFHPALLGPHRTLFDATGMTVDTSDARLEHALVDEIRALSAPEFDLLAWLVCTHHGKVRCVWTSTPHDQEKRHGGIHGVCEGDTLPSFALAGRDDEIHDVPVLTLSLAPAELGVGARYGASWCERVAALRSAYGPFALTFLEAILRIADWRASARTTEDPIA